MSQELKSDALAQLQTIFHDQSLNYQKRLDEFQELQEEAIAQDLPRVQKIERNIAIIKWSLISVVIAAVVFQFI